MCSESSNKAAQPLQRLSSHRPTLTPPAFTGHHYFCPRLICFELLICFSNHFHVIWSDETQNVTKRLSQNWTEIKRRFKLSGEIYRKNVRKMDLDFHERCICCVNSPTAYPVRCVCVCVGRRWCVCPIARPYFHPNIRDLCFCPSRTNRAQIKHWWYEHCVLVMGKSTKNKYNSIIQ